MQLPPRLLGCSAVWSLALVGVTGNAVSQVPDGARLSTGIVIGTVTDTAGRPVSETEVAITRESDSVVVAVGSTDSQGVTRLLRVPSGGPYTILARKIGYRPMRTPGVQVREGDTLRVPFVLQSHITVLPEVATAAKAPRLLARGGFLGIRLFKCLFFGFGRPDEEAKRESGCMQNSDAHAARQAAREAAAEIQRAARRVDKAIGAGRRPDPDDALLVLNTGRTCSTDIPKRPPWPQPDPDVQCREIVHRLSRETLDRLGKVLAALEAAEPSEEELRRREEARQGGTLVGLVTDTTTGAALVDAEVIVIWDSSRAIADSATSNVQGKVMLSIPPSSRRYSIVVRKIGYTPLQRVGVPFPGGDTITLRFALSPLVSLVSADRTRKPSGSLAVLPDVTARGYYDCNARFNPCDLGQGAKSFWEHLSQQKPDSNPRQSARNRDMAKRIQKAVRRVERAIDAGRHPDPNDALVVGDAAQVCVSDMSTDDGFFALCHELIKRTPRRTLERLDSVLEAMGLVESRDTVPVN